MQLDQPPDKAANKVGTGPSAWNGAEKQCRGRPREPPSKKIKTSRQESNSSQLCKGSAPPQQAFLDGGESRHPQHADCETSRLLALLDVACENLDALFDRCGGCQEVKQVLISAVELALQDSVVTSLLCLVLQYSVVDEPSLPSLTVFTCRRAYFASLGGSYSPRSVK
jgi:hypothetical protein